MRFKLRMPFSNYRLSVSLQFVKNRQLTLEEQIALQRFNDRYREKFGERNVDTLSRSQLDYWFQPLKVLPYVYGEKSEGK